MPVLADNWYLSRPTYTEFWLTVKLMRVLQSNFVMVRPSAGMAVSSGIVLCFLGLMAGVGAHVVGSGKGTVNHIYGTFTCAKERLVNAGRR
jgi:hypothetical protein